MYSRSKKSDNNMTQYYYVIGGFLVVCVFSILATVFMPKTKFAEMQIIDQSQILIHNGQGHQFKHGENKMFEGMTLADAKSMFMSALSDTNNVPTCKTSRQTKEDSEFEEMEIDIPDSYDWREQYPQCV